MDKEASTSLDRVDIEVLDASEVGEAVNVMAGSFRDNPVSVAIFGESAERRLRKMHTFISAAFAMRNLPSHTLVARTTDGNIVGVCGMLPPGECLPTLAEKLRMMPRLLSIGPRGLGRTMRWLGVWDKHHPAVRHWHLGPVAVDTRLQGLGVGSKLMRAFCRRVDEAGEDAYLETDKEINVRFYKRFGFEVISEENVLGAPNWFMFRRFQQGT